VYPHEKTVKTKTGKSVAQEPQTAQDDGNDAKGKTRALGMAVKAEANPCYQ